MTMNYQTFVQRFADMAGTLKSDINPSIMIPAAIDYSEARIYRELNLISAQITNTSATLTSSSRSLTLPTNLGNFVSVQEVNVVTPSSLTITTGGTRNKLAPATLNWLNFLYPSEAAAGVPSLFAIKDNTTIIVGQSPDQAYQVEVVGTIRPVTLSNSNSSTFITQFYPDLMLAAAMVFVCGYVRDKGLTTPQSGDISAAGQYWEAEYQKLYQSAIAEDVRIKYNQTLPALAMPQPTAGGPA